MPYESAELRQAEQIVQGVRALGFAMPEPEGWATDLLGPRPTSLRVRVEELAGHADREWPHAALLFFKNVDQPYRLLYETVYRSASRAVHGKAYATGAFVDLTRQPTVVVRAAENPTSIIGYEWAVWSLAIMLIIAGEALGWPANREVQDAIVPHLPGPSAT
jgi:hypothetical protein